MNYRSITFTKAAVLVALAVALVACGSGATPSAVSDTSGATTSASFSAASAAKLNLNTATQADFLTIPNVGNRMVREFQEYRPYTSILQFRREIGKYVDEAQVTAYEQYVFVPVDVNQADAETLKQLPGVDEAVAAELIAGRPYASNDAFLTALAAHLSSAQLETARRYLATQ
jgi:DNA uptake protein ComE-like DNA-binding protein